jgi:peptidyl-prolyl cis-trans isomerase A (cyclophilin A)
MSIVAKPILPLVAMLLTATVFAPAAHAQTPETVPPAAPAPPPTPALPPDTPAPATPDPSSAQLPDAPGSAPATAVVQPTGATVVFDTSMGRLTCKFFDKQAPVTVENFIGLANGTKDWTDPVTGQKVHGKRYYDGTTFHRVIPNFMIQGGDRKGDGSGDAGYYIDNENTPDLTFNVPGRLAMANSGPNTNSTQFFITEVPYPDLDGKYTIFGQCDPHTVLMVATIARLDRNASDKPLTTVTIDKVMIVRPGDPMPALPGATPAASVPQPK